MNEARDLLKYHYSLFCTCCIITQKGLNGIVWSALVWYFSGLEFWIFENSVVTDHTVVTQGGFCVQLYNTPNMLICSV